MAKLIGVFEVCDLGVDHPQYFPGFGTAFTGFDEAFVGVGDTPAEAMADCLEQIASAGWDCAPLDADEDVVKALGLETPDCMELAREEAAGEVDEDAIEERVRAECPEADEEDIAAELATAVNDAIDEIMEGMDEPCQYYVGIRFSEADEDETEEMDAAREAMDRG